MTIRKALTIAGSDSGGGAGIQADLKTFAAFGVHGMSAITSITAQDTKDVTAIKDVSPDVIRSQIRAVASDIGVDAAKTGMLHTTAIIEAVAAELRKYDFPLVVDPVMISKSGVPLLVPEARKSLISKIVPLADVVTPNIPEAEVLSGIKVKNLSDAERAGRTILQLGADMVVVKGGHMPIDDKSIDLLITKDMIRRVEAPWSQRNTTHGTGCCFSAAIAANLAKGLPAEDSVEIAKKFVTRAIEIGLEIGSGHGPVSPTGQLFLDAERFRVIQSIQSGVRILENSKDVAKLMPESQSNLAMALPLSSTTNDVAGVPGRLVKIGDSVRSSSSPAFGASSHVARMILVALEYNPRCRAAMNIRHDQKLINLAKGMGYRVSSYDRRKEPKEIKQQEGRSTSWGTKQAIRKAGGVPDIIYHEGDWGKEPMAVVFGGDAEEVANKVRSLAEEYGKYRK